MTARLWIQALIWYDARSYITNLPSLRSMLVVTVCECSNALGDLNCNFEQS